MISLASTISGIRTLADQTVRLTIDLQETSPEQIAELFRLKGGYGHFLFKEKPVTEEDTKDLPEIKVDRGDKTPSQRLRGVLYILWEQTKSSQSFEQFYLERMSQLTEMIKEKLN